jgi:hypothetical protein
MEIYEIKLHEVLWGGLLVALTMAIHGTGMFAILQVADRLKERFAPLESFLGGLGVVILASVMILIVNTLEVMMWTIFFFLKGVQVNHSTAFYNAMLNYTTLSAGYLPSHWRLLEPLLGMAGLLTVAWSTGILYMLAQDFQETQLRKRKRRREEQGKAARKPEGGTVVGRDH